jgi:hypothetical protein
MSQRTLCLSIPQPMFADGDWKNLTASASAAEPSDRKSATASAPNRRAMSGTATA